MVSSLAFLFKLNKPCRLPDSGLPAIQCGSSVLDFAMDPFNRQQLAAGEYWSEDLGHFGCLLFRWANQLLHGLGIIGKQNSGLVNFISEYYCVYHLFHLLKKWLWRPKTGIKDGFKEKEHKIPYETFRLRKQDYLFTCSISSRNFPLEPPKKLCSILLSNWIFW